MLGMRIDRVVVRVVVFMAMILIQTANPGAECLTEVTRGDVRSRRLGALTFHMMMMTGLRHTDLRLKTEYLLAIFTQGAIHGVVIRQDPGDPVRHGGEDQGMVIEVIGLGELD